MLQSFNRTGSPLWMSAQDNASTPNYVFGAGDVMSFLDAKLLGAPLAASISSTPAQLAAYTGDVTRWVVALVAIPLMVIAAVATHFTARASVARQRGLPDGAQQAAIMNTLVPWVFPIGVLVGGSFLPLAILVYWLSSNVWTLAQHATCTGFPTARTRPGSPGRSTRRPGRWSIRRKIVADGPRAAVGPGQTRCAGAPPAARCSPARPRDVSFARPFSARPRAGTVAVTWTAVVSAADSSMSVTLRLPRRNDRVCSRAMT